MWCNILMKMLLASPFYGRFMRSHNHLRFVQGLEADTHTTTMRGKAVGASTVNYSQLAIEAYEYGFPLVMEVATELAFLVSNPNATTNIFLHKRQFSATDDKSVVRPNQDTLYSTAFLDLSKGPLVMNIPVTTSDQYYLIQMMDAWTNVIANPGSRTTGHAAQRYLVVGPKGIPRNLKTTGYDQVLRSPTNLVWIIVRTLVRNDNFEEVWAIQDQYKLSPWDSVSAQHSFVVAEAFEPFMSAASCNRLSDYLLSFVTLRQLIVLRGKANAKRMIQPFVTLVCRNEYSSSGTSNDFTVPELVEQLSGTQYFSILSLLMCRNPALLPQDAEALQRYEIIGFKPCRRFRPPSQATKAIQEAPAAVYQGFRSSTPGGVLYNGWRTMVTDLGKFGTKYRLRASIAYAAIGANLPEDAVYPDTCSAQNGEPMTGDKRYTVTFEASALPPVQAFWSVTMYDTSWYFIVNPSALIQRNKLSSVSSEPPLVYEANGSLKLFFQPNAPVDASKVANWIPTMTGVPFCLTLRLYAPEEPILNLTWVPPPVIHQSD